MRRMRFLESKCLCVGFLFNSYLQCSFSGGSPGAKVRHISASLLLGCFVKALPSPSPLQCLAVTNCPGTCRRDRGGRGQALYPKMQRRR